MVMGKSSINDPFSVAMSGAAKVHAVTHQPRLGLFENGVPQFHDFSSFPYSICYEYMCICMCMYLYIFIYIYIIIIYTSNFLLW